MAKRPKYIWFSFIAFCIISYQCRTSILAENKNRDYHLWFHYIGTELLWGSITSIIPAGIFAMLMCIASNYSDTLKLIINVLGFVYLYFGGVILSAKLFDWKVKNIDIKSV